MHKLRGWRWGLLVLGVLLGFGLVRPTVHAATKVLLVYDSQNRATHGENKIATVQRILAGLNIDVKTVAAADYQAGQLQAYQGVVTMINWPQTDLNNAAFTHDRQQFKGTKLHIGRNLTATEARDLGAQPVKLYHQQFTLQNSAGTIHQLLPFSETMTVLTKLPKEAQSVGVLKTQAVTARTYSYGTIVNHQGYLPYLATRGYSFVVAAQMMAQLFGHRGHYQPLLTITKVTPYSNLTLLAHLSQTLYEQGIPFAVSTTSVSENGHFKAFQRFAKVLRLVENRGGVVFLKTPTVGGVTASSGGSLSQLMDDELVQLAQNQVFPVGISTSIYWNQDAVYRQYALKKASHVLFLPNPANLTYAKQDNQATHFKQSLYGLDATSLATVTSGSDLGKLAVDFAIPTAITVTMPNSSRSLRTLERRIQQLPYQWFNPVTQGWQTKITSGTATFEYRQGAYFLNGTQTTIAASATRTKTLAPVKPAESWMNRFFKVQGSVLLIFFGITFVIFIGFIWFGRKIYLNMFKR
ncbi:hypothetical protein C5Z26_10600 [Lactobacillus sp. CBA3606]|uniref:hypothetical protein n=1 Tax=Lactobacillus sp. CBA3606 TaxID=2099789 RepID=UPI000CFB3B28|nr:hypothetical protein [Lactobacillus sp. CBA3606]AVK64528.1 hypothetical protein C5Z26_10600 [Lactobacillus sp. CBA3606]